MRIEEILPLVKNIKGGKALSTDCLIDTFFAKKTLKEYLKNDLRIIRIAQALERQSRSDKTLLECLQDKVAKSLTVLYNYWIQGEGIPLVHSTARNFFIYKSDADPKTCTIDQLRPISATSIVFKLMEIVIKNRIEKEVRTKRVKQLDAA